MDDFISSIDTEDRTVLVDVYKYRSHDVTDLVKRLGKLHRHITDSKPTDDWIKTFINVVVACYLNCVESIKLSRSVFKLIQTWDETHRTTIEKEFEDFMFGIIKSTDISKTQLTTVSYLLENNGHGQSVFAKHSVVVLKWLSKQFENLLKIQPSSLSTKETGKLYMFIRIVLQLYQFCPVVYATPVFSQTDNETIMLCRTLFKNIISILHNQGYNLDCIFLSGTAVSLVLVKSDNEQTTIVAFWKIYHTIGTDKEFTFELLLKNNHEEVFQPEGVPELNMRNIAIMKGILSCGNHLLQNQPFVKKCFDEIVRFCQGPMSLHYHAFSTLEQFLKLLQSVTNVTLLNIDELTSATIDLVWLNWDSPVQDVPQIVTRIFTAVLQIWYHQYKHSRCSDIIAGLLSRLQTISWYVKGQYRILAALVPYVESKQMLSSDIRKKLLLCMSTNFLAASGADVYKSFLSNMRKNEDFLSNWKDGWSETVLQGLTSSNRLQRSNIGHYWIPSTLKIIPEVTDFLMGSLKDIMSTHSVTRQWILHAKVLLTKNIRLYTGEFPKEMNIIHEALYSNDDDIRMDAFSVICSSLKKADRLKEEESRLLQETLPYNLKIDSAPFRQQLLTNIKNLLVRIRDSYRAISKDQDEATLDRSLYFVSWLNKLCIDNIFIGACFQRRKMCLDLIQITLEILYPTNLPPITMAAQNRGLWDMYSHNSRLSILHCILDGADEIQNLATKLLLEYFPWPWTPSDLGITQYDLAESLLLSAFEFCNKPKQHENRIGVLLCQILFVKYILELNWSFPWQYENGEYLVKSVTKGDNLSCQNFLISLTNHIHQSFLTAKENPVQASVDSPIHGFVNALMICMTELAKRQPRKMNIDSIQRLVDLNCDIISFMMEVMSTESSEDSGPSFAELGLAVENMILSCDTEYSETTSLSSQHQFLLSWCWINIKECCHSLSRLCQILLEQNHFTTKTDILLTIKDMFIQVLTKCRHRGVIEGCRTSFVQFISHLFTSEDLNINSIPREIVGQAFASFKRATTSSVTRRSAGFPIILQTIVTVERRHKQTILLQECIDQLFILSNEALPVQYNDQIDLPQVHGLNILNTLFGDSSLSAALMPYTSKAVVLVIHSFESPVWLIRNSATMLFSSLVMRIFGQKKNCMEETWRGITLQEFKSLYPDLPPLMSQCLDTALEEDLNRIDKIKTSLFPVLTLLSGLAPNNSLGDKTLLAIGNQVLKFLSSPVYFLRTLAASAYIAFIPLESVANSIKFLCDQLSIARTNQLHGLLLCLQKLTSHGLQKDHSLILKDLLFENKQILYSACGIVKATYIQLLKTLCWESAENMLELTDLLTLCYSEVKIAENFSIKEDIEIKQRSCILNGSDVYSVIKEYLPATETQSSVMCIDCLLTNLQEITNEDLTHIQKYLSEYLASGSIQYPPLLTGILQLMIKVHYRIGSDNVITQLCKYWTRETTHTHNTIQSLNLVIGAVCIENRLGAVTEEIEIWCKNVYLASQTIGAEHFKVAVGNCLKIAGSKIISMATDHMTFDSVAFLLIRSAFNLIDDEDSEIRNLVVDFIASLQWETKTVQYEDIQFNTASKMLYDLVVCKFWNSGHMIRGLYDMLYRPGNIKRIWMQRIQQKRKHLFEKEDNNFFSEKIVNSCNIYSTIMSILHKHTESDAVVVDLGPETVTEDFQFLISVMMEKQGNHLINTTTDSILLEAVTGLILATHTLMVIKTADVKIAGLLQQILQNDILPASYRRMMQTLLLKSSRQDEIKI